MYQDWGEIYETISIPGMASLLLNWSATTHSEQKSESIPRMAVCHTFFSQWYYYSARRVVSHDLLASHSILKQKFQYYYVLFLKVVIYLVLHSLTLIFISRRSGQGDFVNYYF